VAQKEHAQIYPPAGGWNTDANEIGRRTREVVIAGCGWGSSALLVRSDWRPSELRSAETTVGGIAEGRRFVYLWRWQEDTRYVKPWRNSRDRRSDRSRVQDRAALATYFSGSRSAGFWIMCPGPRARTRQAICC